MKWKISIDSLMLNILWLFGCNVLQPFKPYSYQVRLGVSIICGLYVITRIKSVKKNSIQFYLFPLIVALSTVLHYFPHNMGLLLNGLVYSLIVLEIIVIFLDVARTNGVGRLASSIFSTSFIVWVINAYTILSLGRNVENAVSVYFVGSKFASCYFSLALLSLYCLLYDIKLPSQKLGFFIIALVSAYLDYYMGAYTGLFMKISIIVLIVLGEMTVVKNGNKRYEAMADFLKKPIVFISSVIISGLLAVMLNVIIAKYPAVSNLINYLGKESTIESRINIYSNLVEIVKVKPWLGYGYESMIVSQYYGVNAQNGFFRLLIFFGMTGIISFLLMIRSCILNARNRNSIQNRIILYIMYSFVFASVVEISYNYIFIVIMCLYKISCEFSDDILHPDNEDNSTRKQVAVR